MERLGFQTRNDAIRFRDPSPNNPYGVDNALWTKLDGKCRVWIKEYSERLIELEGHDYGKRRS